MEISFHLVLLSTVVLMAAAQNLTDISDLMQHNLTHKVHYDVDDVIRSLIPEDYENDNYPYHADIKLAIIYLSVPSVKFSRGEIEVEFVFAAGWQDSRLIHTEIMREYGATHRFIKLPHTLKSRFWIPYIQFTECKNCKLPFATGGDLREMIYDSTKRVTLAYFRDTMLFACQYDLSYYPFDYHECRIIVQLLAAKDNDPAATQSYHDDQNDYVTVDGVTTISGNLTDVHDSYFTRPRDYIIRKGLPAEFDFDYVNVVRACSDRTFAPAISTDHCLQYGIRFHRISAYYLMLIYTPSFTIVVISWISFWISVDAAAPRVTLGLTSLLTLTTQFANAQKDLPPVAYVKALDVWMIMCVIMVFGSLVEFALAYAGKLQKKKAEVAKNIETPYSSTCGERDLKNPTPIIKPEDVKKKHVNRLDSISKIAFPLVFVLFNIVYWPCYGRGG